MPACPFLLTTADVTMKLPTNKTIATGGMLLSPVSTEGISIDSTVSDVLVVVEGVTGSVGSFGLVGFTGAIL